MNRLPLVFAFGFLLALGGAMEAQVVPPKTQSAKKAKKVWTDEDFPKRPAAKAGKEEATAPKAEATAAKPEKPGAAAPPSAEQLAELDKLEEEPKRRAAELQVQVDAAWAELKALEQQRDAAPSLEAQGAINAQIQEKQKQVTELVDQLMQVQKTLAEIRKKREVLLPPPSLEVEETKPPEPPAKEKALPKPPQ